MAVCAAESLVQCRGEFEVRDQIGRFQAWLAEGPAPGARPAVRKAIALASWRRTALTGSHDPQQLSPEALSRCAPAAVCFHADLPLAIAVAADIAAVTGQDLAEVMMSIGKGAQGQTKGLKALGIQVGKGATIQDILTAATAKYGGTAAEIANSTSGKFAQSQVRFNETMEDLGYKLLPTVNKFLDWLATTGMPMFQSVIDAVAPVITDLIDNAVAPLAESFGALFECSENV
jgi:hypothetical protein